VATFFAVDVRVRRSGGRPVVLVELNVVEQRYQAVEALIDGASVTDVARRHGVARQTVHGWLRRYAVDLFRPLSVNTETRPVRSSMAHRVSSPSATPAALWLRPYRADAPGQDLVTTPGM
jgi:hypothetical protein